MREYFLLRPGMTFLNHGSFGACPQPVFEIYQQWQHELEAQPVEFLSRRVDDLLREARGELAEYLGVRADNLVFVSNATTGVNIVARSLPLGPGNEILGTDQEYGAIDRTWRFLCSKSGASYVNQPVPLPVTTPEEFVEQFWQRVTPRTRVISLSHITSATALIFPVKEICRRAREAGIITIIDGAHAPGQIPLNLEELGVDFYSGNCHKWLCAPKGAGFLFARPEMQELVEPLVVSWGWESVRPGPSRFVDWLEWQGTRDISAYLSVPAAIRFQAQHNWPELRQKCHAMLAETRRRIEQLTGLAPISPEDWFGQMASIPIPVKDGAEFQKRLWDEYQIESPVMSWNGKSLLRVSVQAYNTQEELDYLLEVLARLL